MNSYNIDLKKIFIIFTLIFFSENITVNAEEEKIKNLMLYLKATQMKEELENTI